MNQRLKDYLGGAAIVALIAFAFSVGSLALSYSRSLGPLTLRSFSVSGEGSVTAVPDIAQFSATIITEGGLDLENLQNENSEKSNSVVDFLKENGVDEKDIKTSGYSVNPRRIYPRCLDGNDCPAPEITGYSIYQTVSVKVRDVDSAGSLLSGVVSNGANSVSGLSFTIDDPVILENNARAEAIKQAEMKAEAIADAGGFRVGKLLSIDTVGSPSPIYRYNTAFDEGFGGAIESVPSIEPGSEEIAVNVTLTFEIR